MHEKWLFVRKICEVKLDVNLVNFFSPTKRQNKLECSYPVSHASQRWVCRTSRSDLSSKTKCDQIHICERSVR